MSIVLFSCLGNEHLAAARPLVSREQRHRSTQEEKVAKDHGLDSPSPQMKKNMANQINAFIFLSPMQINL